MLKFQTFINLDVDMVSDDEEVCLDRPNNPTSQELMDLLMDPELDYKDNLAYTVLD